VGDTELLGDLSDGPRLLGLSCHARHPALPLR
jgi:hypothetical protein